MEKTQRRASKKKRGRSQNAYFFLGFSGALAHYTHTVFVSTSEKGTQKIWYSLGGNLEGLLVVQRGVGLLDDLQLLLDELVVGRGGAGLLVLLGNGYISVGVY